MPKLKYDESVDSFISRPMLAVFYNPDDTGLAIDDLGTHWCTILESARVNDAIVEIH